MYTCICNALRERAVREVAPACRNPAEVYKALACRPQCGRCGPTVRAILVEHRGAGRVDERAAEPPALPDSALALAAE